MNINVAYKILIIRNLKLLFNNEYSCRIFTNSVYSTLKEYAIVTKASSTKTHLNILSKFDIYDAKRVNTNNSFITSQSRLLHQSKQPPTNSTEHQIEKICWSCGKCRCNVPPKQSGKFFCCCCGIIQGIKNKENLATHDYFSLFDLPIRYDLSEKELHKAFLCIQAQLHPDKFSQKSETEKHHSEDQSSLLNEAFATLQQPLSRALYLLKLNAVTIDEKQQEIDTTLLIHVMEMNERIEDAGDNITILREIEIEVDKEYSTLEKHLSLCFEAQEISEACLLVQRMKYLQSLHSRLQDAIVDAL